jgi:hypothetical protein
VFNEIRDRMDKQDAVITTWCDDHDDEFEDEDDRAFNGEGRFVPRGERCGRGFQRDPRWQNGIDRNLGNIKMKIPLKGKMILKRIWNGKSCCYLVGSTRDE